jgi:hypothetical protein
VDEVLLELNGANGGVYLQGSMKVCVMGSREDGEELRGPGTCVAAVDGQALVYLEGAAGRERDEETLAAHGAEVFVVLDAVEAVAVSYLILVDENLVGTFEGRRNDEAAPLVVQGGQNDRSGGDLFNTG